MSVDSVAMAMQSRVKRFSRLIFSSRVRPGLVYADFLPILGHTHADKTDSYARFLRRKVLELPPGIKSNIPVTLIPGYLIDRIF